MNRLAHFLKHKFVRDTATLQVGTLFNSAGNLISAVMLAHLLGARQQGQFYVAITLYALLWFLINQGVVSATVSQVAAAGARGLKDKVATWLAFLAKAYLVFGAILFGLGYFVLPWLARVLLHSQHESPEVLGTLGVWAWWLTLTPLLEMPRIVACAALQGTRTMLPFAQIENGQEAARVCLVILGALVTNSPEGPVIGTLAASAIGSVLAIELYNDARRAKPDVLPGWREIAAQFAGVPLKRGLPLGVKLGLVRSIDALGVQVLPTLFLQRFGSSDWVAYLRLAQRLMNVPLMFMQGISRTALPRLSELAGAQHRERFKRTFIKTSLLSGLFISTGILASLLVIPRLLEVLFPPDYRQPIWLICRILVPGMLIMSFSIANDTFYIVTNTLKVGVWLCVIGILVNAAVVGSLAWLYPTVGVAIGLSFTMAWSITHNVYAALYFRGHGRPPGAGAPPTSGAPGPSPALRP